MFSRRYFVIGVSTICSVFFAGVLRPGNSAISGTVKTNMTEEDEFKVFMELSRKLTGVEDLDPAQGKHYFNYQKKSNTLLWSRLIRRIRQINLSNSEQSFEFIKKKLVEDPEVWRVAKSINKLWYSGWTSPVKDVPLDVRATAYREALAWRAMGLTPKGVSTGHLWQTPIK